MLQDFRYAVRSFARTPFFTGIAIATLALGVGANTAVFSVVNTLLLRPLPYRAPDRLVMVHEVNPDGKDNSGSPGNYLHWRDLATSFEEMAAVSHTFRTTVSGAGEPEELPMQYVSATVFPMLGVPAALGRTFTTEEDQPNRDGVAVISDALWRRKFNADRTIVNRGVHLDGNLVTVVGVMPPGFSILDKTVAVWRPAGFSAESRTPRGRWLFVVARLTQGTTIARAQQDMDRVQGEMIRLFPAFNREWRVRVHSLSDQLSRGVRPALLTLVGAVGFVLLIACANVANLLLARATTRQRELAVRTALGAGRRRIVTQMFVESGVLAAAGTAAGLLLAWWAVAIVRTTVAAHVSVPRLEAVRIDQHVLAFAVAAAAACAMVFGLAPALSAAGADPMGVLKDGGRTGTSVRGRRTRSLFVVVETALALVLLVAAGLLVRSFVALMRVDTGFDPSGTITMKVTVPASRNREARQFFDRLYSEIDALAGVQASGGISFLPLNGLGAATDFSIPGRPASDADRMVADVRVVTHDYFKAMRIPLLKGRLFDARDSGSGIHRVVISADLARRFFPNDDPIGKRIAIDWNEQTPDEIIGVVGDVHQLTLDDEIRATTYWPPARFAYPWNTLVIRTSGDPVRIVPEVAALVHRYDSTIAVADVRTMDEVLSGSAAERRLTMLLLSAFATVALLLAAVGIYGVVSCSITERVHEIGIRMALGAARQAVMRMVLAQALTLSISGVAVGAVGAWLLTRLMKTLLFGVPAFDPVTFVAVSALLVLVAAVAAWIPGRRATRIDPALALRSG